MDYIANSIDQERLAQALMFKAKMAESLRGNSPTSTTSASGAFPGFTGVNLGGILSNGLGLYGQAKMGLGAVDKMAERKKSDWEALKELSLPLPNNELDKVNYDFEDPEAMKAAQQDMALEQGTHQNLLDTLGSNPTVENQDAALSILRNNLGIKVQEPMSKTAALQVVGSNPAMAITLEKMGILPKGSAEQIMADSIRYKKETRPTSVDRDRLNTLIDGNMAAGMSEADAIVDATKKMAQAKSAKDPMSTGTGQKAYIEAQEAYNSLSNKVGVLQRMYNLIDNGALDWNNKWGKALSSAGGDHPGLLDMPARVAGGALTSASGRQFSAEALPAILKDMKSLGGNDTEKELERISVSYPQWDLNPKEAKRQIAWIIATIPVLMKAQELRIEAMKDRSYYEGARDFEAEAGKIPLDEFTLPESSTTKDAEYYKNKYLGE